MQKPEQGRFASAYPRQALTSLVVLMLAVGFSAACAYAPRASSVSDVQAARNDGDPIAPAITNAGLQSDFVVRQWALKLTRTEIDVVDRSDTDFVIVDPTGLEPQVVARLKTRPDGSRRAVVAYINIGEAETYRDYWQPSWNRSPPSWVGAENPNWANHYYTAYWHPDWQRILFGTSDSKLDRILAAEFDGLFMDGVDKYLVWPGREEQSRRDMYTLIDRIAAYSRARRPGFLIIPNNAEDLLVDAGYRSTIDAIVKEDLFFGVEGEGRRNNTDLINWSLARLKLATDDYLPVFVIEYVSAPAQVNYAERRMRNHRLLGTFGRRDLASLTRPMRADTSTVNQLRRLPSAD